MSYLPVKLNPLKLHVKEPGWKSLIQKLDMVSYHCSMPVLENVQVSLREILEVHGEALEEWELWGVLYQTVQAVQDIFLKGQACKDGKPQFLVTPDNLLCSARGRVTLNACLPDEIKETPYWCQELTDDEFCSENSNIDKIYVFTIGQTIHYAAYYGVKENNQKRLSPLLRTIFQSMCQIDVDLRRQLSEIAEVCNLHAGKHMNGFTFAKAVSKLHRDVLGSLPENEILAQIDHDFVMENDDVQNSKEVQPDIDYSSKYLSYGQRLGYHPEISSTSQIAKKAKTPKERWKEAYQKVVSQIRKSKMSAWNTNEVLSSWKKHKAQESIFRVYEELAERRRMLELLRLSINIGPVAPSDVEKNPLLTTGLKPKTIAELVLLLQRPTKPNAITSNPSSEVPIGTEDISTKITDSLTNVPCSSKDCDSYEKPFYNIDKVALSQPFSSCNSELHPYQGPEFIINKIKPHIRLVPFCSDKEFHQSAFTVVVTLLTGEALDIECVSSVTGKQLYQAVADHLKLRERYLFGLAYLHGDEHIFIEKKQHMFDLLHSSSAVSKNVIQMHFRVKFYLDDVHLMGTPHLRHLYYLQLRNDFLSDNFYCDLNTAWTLGGLALQAEFGNYDDSLDQKEYFLLDHYLSFTCIKQLNKCDVKTKLRDYHMKLKGISRELAELKFIQGMIKLSEYGYHFHKVFQDKHNLSSGVWLGIHSKGIDVFEKVSGKKTVCQSYPWQNIKRISFCKKYFCIAPRAESHTGKHVVYRFYTSVMNRSQYLFNISMAHHKFFLKLRTVSKASEIFIEDLDEEYLYFCDKSGLEKEVGCDLYDTKGKFQLKSKTLRHKTSSQNDLEFLNEPYTAEVSKPKRLFKFKVRPGSLNSSKEKGTPVLITRSSSVPNPMKKKLASRNSSTLPRTSCGKRTMKFVKLYKDPNCGFGMVITCGNTYDTVLHGAFVERVLPGSPADLDGNIAPGDQIMSVNGTDVQSDHFLTVVDLIQWSTNSLDIVIAKNQTSNLTNNFKKDIVERPFSKSKAWIVGNEKFKEAMPPIKAEDIHNGNEIPIPKPRKKWLEQEQTLNCVEPDLTLNHSSNANLDSRKKSSDSNITRDNIPDIIASQMRHALSSINSDLSSNTSEVNTESCELNTLVQEDADSNYLLPGEVFHVVLDKKGGSLGLNIYQGSESCSDQRYIYIHSVIPNGAADLDGRIKPGDKLLEVNSVPLDNLSYQEVVTKLRISPQVAHLVLEKGNLMETDSAPPKEQNSVTANGFSNNKTTDCNHESGRKRNESSASAEACFDGHKDCEDQITYSSLPVISNTPKESAKDSVSSGYLKQNGSGNVCSKFDLSSPIHAKVHVDTTPYRFKSSLTSYSSTPNLAENSDEDDPNGSGGFLYRNRSTECLNTPHFMRPHQALLDFYQNYSHLRGSVSSLHEIPAVPIRKKKLKKLDDIYNYCNPDNTFEVSVRKSSRGLGLSIFGGADVIGRDNFSQLIRIRKLYPLQPALDCGKLMLGDVILEVNGTKMVGLTNTEALEVLRCAPADVVLKVFRPSKSLIPSFSTYKGGIWPFFDSSSSSASSSLSRGENNCYNVETGEFEVTLIKRGGSLGFSISSKESSSESQREGIFVKALVREPAISDGRIHPGDKILQVNGTEMSSMTHAEAIEFIRNVPDAVTLKLLRNDPPATPGYNDEEYSITKPLRWEAVGFLNDRLKHKDSSDEGSTPKRKLKRGKHTKNEMFSNASSNTSTESDTSSSSGHELILEEKPEDLSLEGVGLQRNQRPKSLDMLNSSDRKRCPTLDDDSFHRQSSVMCANVDAKGDGSASPEKKTTLLKWRGSTLPHTDEVDGPGGMKNEVLSSNGSEAADSVSDDEKPVPFPRTTSCVSEWVHTFNVDLDRGWQSRLGFSLYDAPPDSPGSPRSHLLKAAEVKAVYPNSLAEKDGRIKVGDRLIAVNNESLINLPAAEAIDILRKTRGLIRMVFCRLEKPT